MKDYPALVDRFKLKFASCSDNLERAAAALVAKGEPVLAGSVGRVKKEEARRLELQLELQVLRQRRALSKYETDERRDFDQRTSATASALEACDAGIAELHEEIRCEIADMDEEG